MHNQRSCNNLWGAGMAKNNLLGEIEKLRRKMEQRSRVVPLNSKELLRLSERLDRLINRYLRNASRSETGPQSGSPREGVPKKNLRLSRQPFKIKNRE